MYLFSFLNFKFRQKVLSWQKNDSKKIEFMNKIVALQQKKTS